ncbi:probable glutamate receptor [Cherax quadricarinatus]|uniref:probable glutamate receptor n=1 Tax=Cherax quadricarinatus TaxID=27406 RepID=UPI0023793E01|nr:probable glutamate receptor [Cherax quadricarinatus]
MDLVLDIFAKIINFEYELVLAPENLWGGPLRNGSWTGMLGMLQRNEVELAIAPFFVTPERESVCDFTTPVYSDSQAILMVRPAIQNDIFAFVKPFTPSVWMLLLLSILSVIIARGSMDRCEEWIFKLNTSSRWSKGAMWAVQALSQESSDWLPKNDAGRLVVTTWLLAAFVFMTSYSGILTAMLTVPRVTIPIDSLPELVAQTKLPWRLEAGSMMYAFFEEAEDELGKKVFSDKAGTFQDCWAARQDVAEGHFAAICDSTTMMKAMSWDFSTTGKCHLYISREKVYSNGILGIAFKTKSKYLPKANKILARLKESGLMNKWLGEQITNTSLCLRPPSADIKEGLSPLSFQTFSGSFLFLASGLAVSSLCFLAEHLMKCCTGE